MVGACSSMISGRALLLTSGIEPRTFQLVVKYPRVTTQTKPFLCLQRIVILLLSAALNCGVVMREIRFCVLALLIQPVGGGSLSLPPWFPDLPLYPEGKREPELNIGSHHCSAVPTLPPSTITTPAFSARSVKAMKPILLQMKLKCV